ncbi:uncharacterized protein LOC129910153 [Episyrphus balteatus]|uniref:uncharacterized protein LOC129910153 n=1 Tax=Episyrphus balteatus TaxID=286459 RepID=UPI00248669A1|nr:uncharacterized protein LOC129910153 [Episyrphus balteatus]
MNDNNNSFSSYDGYYCNNNFQFTDLTTPLDVNSSNHYFSSITEGFSSPQPFLSAVQQHQQQQPTAEPTQTQNQSLLSLHNNLLPFVQIHTTNAQPTNNNFGNIFRRQQNHEEIKSEEPIKSEQSDASAAITASQQQNPTNISTPPDCQANSTGNVTPPSSANNPVPNQQQQQQTQSTPQLTSAISIQRCTQCPYLCLQAESLEKHVASVHFRNNDESPQSECQNKKITCPGCDNIFYAKESLEVHLISDHLMCKNEAKQLLPDLSSEEQPRKSRIYLKNVEFLREPQRQQESILSLDDQGFCNAFQNGNDTNLLNLMCDGNDVIPIVAENPIPISISETQTDKQKISIKSVDVLREPALMRKDELNNFDFLPPASNNDDNHSDILCLDDGGINRYPSFIPSQSELDDLCQEQQQQQPQQQLQLQGEQILLNQESHQPLDKPRRPKIYIKNVDILKEPIFLPPNNLTNVLNVNDDLHFNLLTTNDDGNEFEGTKFIEGINNEYSFDCGGNNFVDCANFLLPSEDSSFMQQQDLPKSKIFIKNVDILKQPQFQEQHHPRRSTNFLHLRTVDELNLMNKNEVENLIAPNLEQNMINTQQQHLVTNSSENSKNSEEVCGFRMMNSDSNSFNKPPDFQTQPTISWTSDYVLDGLDAIIDSNSCSEQKNRHYDLNTPQISIIDEVHDVGGGNEDTHDPEILFVCAEELINDNRDQDDCINSDSIEREQRSFEIVEIMDDLERDQPSRESQPEPVILNLVPETVVDDKAENMPSLDVDPVIVSHEKGRIYVSDNLMEVDKESCGGVQIQVVVQEPSEPVNGLSNFVPKPRGRPFGSNRTGITKLRKLYGNKPAVVDTSTKCDFEGCSFRFKKPDVAEYHKRCHNTEGSRPMVCPECKSTNFSNWNTLHTHLWRTHKIDMELHSCELCNFKTPIYSRLVNTHSKIHSEERNYKCDQCEKAFKNSKQLKNHRRWHRTIAIAPPPDVHRCEECGAAFSHLKTLREHFCKSGDLFCCEVCGKTLSSRSSLKLHMLTHESAKKFKCNSCDYMANDHNAFRRHRMTHDKSKMYICPLCDYKSIQSVAFQKHIRIKHPESADTIVHKCKFCPFATINVGLLTVHLAKHKLREEVEKEKQTKTISNSTSTPIAINVAIESPSSSSLMTMAEEFFYNSSDSNNVSSSNSIASTTSATSAIVLPAAVVTTNTNTTEHHQLENYKTIESSTIIETDNNQQPRNKIKVKSDLVLTDPAKFTSNVVSPLLLHCFDGAVR